MKLNSNIILMRHAENVQDSKIRNDLLPLTNDGIRQAEVASKLLEGKFDIVISSTSLRAITTAKIVSKVEPIKDARLLERGWGNLKHDGKETDEDAKKRFKLFLSETIDKYKNKNLLLVTHGSLIKLAQDVIEEKTLPRDKVNNCMIIEYNKEGQKVLLRK